MNAGHAIAMGLRAAYWTMHRQTMARLARHGVTADQLVILALLVEQDGITQQELVRRATSDPNTIRAMLVLLEKRGLITREPHPTDGRARRVILLRKGKDAYATLMAEVLPLQEEIAALFDGEETQTFVNCLGRLAQAMGTGERPQRRSPDAPTAPESRRPSHPIPDKETDHVPT